MWVLFPPHGSPVIQGLVNRMGKLRLHLPTVRQECSHPQNAANFLDSSRQWPGAAKPLRFGKIFFIPSATVPTSDSLRVSGIFSACKYWSGHLGSEGKSWNRGSAEMFLRSSTMFVVLKWIHRSYKSRQ